MFVRITLRRARLRCVIVGGIVADMGVWRGARILQEWCILVLEGISNARTLCAAGVRLVRGGSQTCEPLTLPHCEDRYCTG